jgi:hypothetical protein
MDIKDWWDRETEEEVVCSTTGYLCGREVGKSGEVWTGEVDGVKPEDTTFMPSSSSA